MEHPDRLNRLERFLKTVLLGRRKISSKVDAQLFLEAIQCDSDPCASVERLVASPSGMAALRSSFRTDLTVSFVQLHSLKLIQYISHPSVKLLGDGTLLQNVIAALIQPPTFWNALRQHFLDGTMPDDGLEVIAWLMLELISVGSTPNIDVFDDVRAMFHQGTILRSENHRIRELGYRIQRVIQLKETQQTGAHDVSAGGRHDNDFADYRKISIYPTTDEFLATEEPYRTAQQAFDGDNEQRVALHLDNQFRLLREDMLQELRNDLQIAAGRRSGHRMAQTLRGLSLCGISYEDQARSKKCALLLRCAQGLEVITAMHGSHE